MAEPANAPRRIYFVVGEESGDALGADLIEQMRAINPAVEAVGLGGKRMKALGLAPLFNISDIAVMGFAGVAARLPLLMRRIRQTANDVLAKQPDMLVLIDSPEFARRVAKRVRAKRPDMPIVKYICPSVWAWRPGRAPGMKAYLDHILAILPFEPQVLSELDGPPASYIGHPLAWQFRDYKPSARRAGDRKKTLLLLPGSRGNEAKLLLPDFKRTVEILAERGNDWRIVLPAVDHLAAMIEDHTSDWQMPVEIVRGEEAKYDAFESADVALAASGTVLLELALYRVPMISVYKLDWLLYLFRSLITGWSAALPNLITDEAFIPERLNDMVRPGWLARKLEALMETEGGDRKQQLAGFERMVEAMKLDEAPGAVAARKLLAMLETKTPA